MLSHLHPELDGARYVVFADSSRQYTDCTPGVCELLGYTREELLQRKIEDISYNAQVAELFADYLQTGFQEGDYVLQSSTMEPVAIHYRAFVFSDGCIAAIWEPITDWRQAYFAALLETDNDKLSEKIAKARELIGRHPGPRQSTLMRDALATLRALKTTR